METDDPKDRFMAAMEKTKPQHTWSKGDTETAYAQVAAAFQLDLRSEEGRRLADEYLSLADPEAVFGPNMAQRIRASQIRKEFAAQAELKIEADAKRLELQLKEDEEKRAQTARILAMSYEQERLELTQKRGLPDLVDVNEHDPKILTAWRDCCKQAAQIHLRKK